VTPSFRDLGVPVDLVGALQAAGITNPFPVQEATLPDGLAGHDLCGRAPTGSGKTLAFGIPMLANINRAAPQRPTGLVLVPTRELALQVTKALVPLAMAKRLYVLAVYGGAPISRQVTALRRGAAVVVATPGRLNDLLEQGEVHLDAVQVVVIDEADRMADMGFMPQVRQILDHVPEQRQTMLWSATLDGDVDQLIRRYQREPRRHEVEAEADTLADVPHFFWKVDKVAKVGTAAVVVRNHGNGIVFVRTRHGADRVAKQLTAAGVTAASIHGDRSQAQRERALQAFRVGQVQALVATDVAARGIHVDGVGVVVHWDPVDDHKDYIHRSGRTGRAGATGVVVSLVTPEHRSRTLTIQRQLDLPVGVYEADRSTAEAAKEHHAPVDSFDDLPMPARADRAPARTADRQAGDWYPRQRTDAPRANRRPAANTGMSWPGSRASNGPRPNGRGDADRTGAAPWPGERTTSRPDRPAVARDEARGAGGRPERYGAARDEGRGTAGRLAGRFVRAGEARRTVVRATNGPVTRRADDHAPDDRADARGSDRRPDNRADARGSDRRPDNRADARGSDRRPDNRADVRGSDRRPDNRAENHGAGSRGTDRRGGDRRPTGPSGAPSRTPRPGPNTGNRAARRAAAGITRHDHGTDPGRRGEARRAAKQPTSRAFGRRSR
jgi:superfamily II DNA/RNA helicase